VITLRGEPFSTHPTLDLFHYLHSKEDVFSVVMRAMGSMLEQVQIKVRAS